MKDIPGELSIQKGKIVRVGRPRTPKEIETARKRIALENIQRSGGRRASDYYNNILAIAKEHAIYP